jgi:DnaJ-class molecular chaperone
VTHVLAALILLGGYALFLLIRPQKNCFRCRGWGARGRRRAACRCCGGTGTRFRLGARVAHRAVLTIRTHHHKEKDHV